MTAVDEHALFSQAQCLVHNYAVGANCHSRDPTMGLPILAGKRKRPLMSEVLV